jgi:hypothetical protein
MQEHLRDRIIRRLDTLTDERAYQVLDFIEFLESKYADRRQAAGTAFNRFADAVEDTLRAGRVPATAIAETVGLMNRAAGVLTNAVQATRAAATEFVTPPVTPATAPAGATAGTAREASSPAHNTPAPGSPQEKL